MIGVDLAHIPKALILSGPFFGGPTGDQGLKPL